MRRKPSEMSAGDWIHWHDGSRIRIKEIREYDVTRWYEEEYKGMYILRTAFGTILLDPNVEYDYELA